MNNLTISVKKCSLCLYISTLPKVLRDKIFHYFIDNCGTKNLFVLSIDKKIFFKYILSFYIYDVSLKFSNKLLFLNPTLTIGSPCDSVLYNSLHMYRCIYKIICINDLVLKKIICPFKIFKFYSHGCKVFLKTTKTKDIKVYTSMKFVQHIDESFKMKLILTNEKVSYIILYIQYKKGYRLVCVSEDF